MSPALGYVHDDPAAIASQTSPHHWQLATFMAGVAAKPVPEHYLDSRLTAALDQDGLGACTSFAVTNMKQLMDFTDWGKYLYNSQSGFTAYDWLKHGSPDGSYPGDGIPNVEGSYPEQALKLAKVYGYPDKNGQLHKIKGYAAQPLTNLADWEAIQQMILEWREALDIGIPWGTNWMSGPPAPFFKMPIPVGRAGGHSFAFGVGWDRWLPDPEWWVVCLQSWGQHWSDPKGLFRFPVSLLYAGAPLGPQVVFKAVDEKDGPMPLTLSDKVARLVDTHVGANVYDLDGKTVKTTVKSGELGIASSAKLTGGATLGDYYLTLFSINGRLDGNTCLKAADCTNVRPAGGDTKAARKAGADAVAKAAVDEAVLQG